MAWSFTTKSNEELMVNLPPHDYLDIAGAQALPRNDGDFEFRRLTKKIISGQKLFYADFIIYYFFPMIRKSMASKRLLFDGPNPFHSSFQSKSSQSRFKLSPLFSIVVG